MLFPRHDKMSFEVLKTSADVLEKFVTRKSIVIPIKSELALNLRAMRLLAQEHIAAKKWGVKSNFNAKELGEMLTRALHGQLTAVVCNRASEDLLRLWPNDSNPISALINSGSFVQSAKNKERNLNQQGRSTTWEFFVGFALERVAKTEHLFPTGSSKVADFKVHFNNSSYGFEVKCLASIANISDSLKRNFSKAADQIQCSPVDFGVVVVNVSKQMNGEEFFHIDEVKDEFTSYKFAPHAIEKVQRKLADIGKSLQENKDFYQSCSKRPKVLGAFLVTQVLVAINKIPTLVTLACYLQTPTLSGLSATERSKVERARNDLSEIADRLNDVFQGILTMSTKKDFSESYKDLLTNNQQLESGLIVPCSVLTAFA
jgi:hypothetical protein